MCYIKFALAAIKSNKMTAVLIIIEIASLLLAVNVLVSTVSDRQMLNKPYEQLLGDNAAVVWDNNYTDNLVSGTAANKSESRQILLEGINADYEIYDSAEAIFSEAGLNSNVTIIAVSDEIYDKMALPLISGNYGGAVASCGVSEGEHTFEYYDSDSRRTFTLNVTGTLTANSYVPLMRSYSSGKDFTSKDFYVSSSGFGKYIITRKSSVSELEDNFAAELGFIIKFPDNFEENMEALRSKAAVTDGRKILQNTHDLLLEDLSDFIPVTICICLVVIVGTISISVIIASKNEKRNAVYWICGFSRKNILILHLANMLLIFVLSVLTAAAAQKILSLFEFDLIAGSNFSGVNLAVTLMLCAFLLAASMVIPAAKSAKTTPIEYFRRTK